MEKNRSLNIDILRSIAVLSVLVFHFFPSYAPWGFVGVDIFIFLSGFLLERKLAAGQNVWNFLERRFIRIYPPLVIVLSLLLGFGFFVLLRDEYLEYLKSLISVVIPVSNFYQASLNGYFDGVNIFRPLLHTWSLSVEIQFYILIAFSYAVISRPAFRIKFIFTAILVSFIYSTFSVSNTTHYFSTGARIWEFMLGALVAHILHLRFSRFGPIVLLVSCILTVYLIDSSSKYPGFLALLPLVFSWSLLQLKLPNSLTYAHWIFRFLASISYSLFLIHYPLLSMLNQFKGQPSLIDRLLVIVISVIAAWIIEGLIVRRVAFLTTFRGALAFTLILASTSVSLVKVIEVFERPVDSLNGQLLEQAESFRLAPNDYCGLGLNIEGRCRFSLSTDGDVLVLGDSIAHAFSPALDSMKEQGAIKSYRQIGAGGCPPFLNAVSEDCLKFWSDMFGSIEPNSFSSVVIAGQWPLYFDGLPPAEIKPAVEDFSFSLLQFLDGYRGDVVFISTPPLGARPRSCFDRVIFFNVSDCNIDYMIAEERRRSQDPLIDSIRLIDRVKIFDPFEFLCDGYKCLVVKDNTILYLDDSHFSVAGARWLSEPLRALLTMK